MYNDLLISVRYCYDSKVSVYSSVDAGNVLAASRAYSLAPGISQNFDGDFHTVTFDQLLVECSRTRLVFSTAVMWNCLLCMKLNIKSCQFHVYKIQI